MIQQTSSFQISLGQCKGMLDISIFFSDSESWNLNEHERNDRMNFLKHARMWMFLRELMPVELDWIKITPIGINRQQSIYNK